MSDGDTGMLKHSIALPILTGRLRGTRWLPASGGKLLRVMMGTYEKEQTALFEKLIHPGDVVFDVGAHVGYYTLLAGALTGPRGRVFAFEPEPSNFAFLKQHAALNGGASITVVNSAVGDHAGDVVFEYGTGSGTGHVASSGAANSSPPPNRAPHGALVVPMLTLDAFAGDQRTQCHAIKIDVEGAEMDVLRGAQSLIASARPVIFLSTHGNAVPRECLEFLRARGYSFEPIVGTDVNTTTEVLCRPSSTGR